MNLRSATKRSLALLSLRDRRLLALSSLLQALTAFLDLAGVLLIGLVGALAVTTVQSQPPPGAVTSLLALVGVEGLSGQQTVLVLAGLAAVLLLSKSIFSSLLTRRILVFLANRQALVSGRLASDLLSRPLVFVQAKSSQEIAYALIGGAGAATLGVLGQITIMITEISLLAVMAAALVVADPLIAAGSFLFFAVVALGLQRALGGWASRVGAAASKADISSLNAVQEVLGAFREVVVSHRQAAYVERIQELRWSAAKFTAESQFIGMFPKYFFEASLVLGGFLLAAVLFSTQDSVAAMATLALFLAAATRVMPSLMRLQGSMLGLRAFAGAAAPTYELAQALGEAPRTQLHRRLSLDVDAVTADDHLPFEASLQIHGVTFTYPGSSDKALSDVTLTIPAGTSVGIVGRSGSGKSTLADVLLGLLEPSQGFATISGCAAPDALERWPGLLAYVPQRIMIVNDSIRANVALGIPLGEVDDDAVWECLVRAHLSEYVLLQPNGLDTVVGESGLRLSGGQRQRLGIARALYSRPQLLVLDEATSALDAETEAAVTEMIGELEGQVTTVVIAHRLSTVRDVDLLVYLENGRVVETGSFEDVAGKVPALKRQAGLMGLA